MLLAVLDKKCGKKFSSHDVFLNIAGGIKTDDTAVDLSIVAALLSSAVDIPISSKDCFAGELSLSGEVRPVSRIDTRISEAMKLGYKRIFISSSSKVQTHYDHIEVKKISKVSELIKYLFS